MNTVPAPTDDNSFTGPATEPDADGPAAGPVRASRSGQRESESARALLVTAAVTGLLIATAAASATALLVAIAVTQAGLLLGWVLGSAMPGRIGGLLVSALACAGADVAVTHWPDSALSPLLAPLGLGVLAMFIHQLTRGVVRARVVESLAGSATVLVAGVALTGWLQLRHEFDGRSLAMAAVAAAGGGCALGQLTDLVWSRPRLDPDVPRGLVGLVVAAATGGAAGTLILRDVDSITTFRAVVISTGLALIAILVSAGLAFVAYGLAVAPPTDATNAPAPDHASAAPPGEPDAVEDVGEGAEFGVAVRPVPQLRPLASGILPLALVAPAAYVLLLSVG